VTTTYRDLYDEVATLRQELDRSEAACASAMAEAEALRGDVVALRRAADRVVQLVDHGAGEFVVGAAIAELRRALDGGGR
jgi:hypothetical protein